MSTQTRIHPFSNGTQFTDWDDVNCCRCVKYDTCEIHAALSASACGDGTVSVDIARRMGYFDHIGHANWTCGEVELTREWQAELMHQETLRAEGSYLERDEWWDWQHRIEDAYYRALEFHLHCVNCGGSIRVLFAADRHVAKDADCICRDDSCVQRRLAADPENDWAALQEIEIPEWVQEVHDGGWGRR